MKPLALALVALATVWPAPRRLARAGVAALGGVAVAWAAWPASFAGGRHPWAWPVTVLAVVAVWWATPHVRAALPTLGLPWVLVGGCAVAVYACVPENDQLWEIAVAIGAAAVAEALVGRPLPDATLAAAMAWVTWAAVFGATGRGSALVGGLFAVLPFVAVAAAVAGRPALLVGAAWLAAALAVARTGGIDPDTPPAVLAAALAAVLATAVTVALRR